MRVSVSSNRSQSVDSLSELKNKSFSQFDLILSIQLQMSNQQKDFFRFICWTTFHKLLLLLLLLLLLFCGSPSYVVTYVLDYDKVVSEFELKSRYNVHFNINNLGKSMNPLILQFRG